MHYGQDVLFTALSNRFFYGFIYILTAFCQKEKARPKYRVLPENFCCPFQEADTIQVCTVAEIDVLFHGDLLKAEEHAKRTGDLHVWV